MVLRHADRFKNQVAIVTGGAAGIGAAVVEHIVLEGGSVVFSDLSETGSEVAARHVANGHRVVFARGDMGDEAFCASLVRRAVDEFGRVDHLVNNAFAFVARALDATAEDWQRSLLVGPVGFARMIQHCAGTMKTTGGGSIVNVGSISASVAQKQRWTYNASKGAVLQLTRCAALDLAPLKIRVNSVSPGWIWSQEVQRAADLAGGRAKWAPLWGSYHMLRRCGEVAEVARPILFLLSEEASFITGTDLAVDGGYQAMGPEGLGDVGVVVGSDGASP